MVGKEGKPIPVIPIAFGLLFVLIVVIAVVLVVGMNREYDDAAGRPGGPVTAGGDGRTSARTKTGRGHAASAAERGEGEPGAAPDAEEMVLTPTGYTIAGQVVDEAGKGVAEAAVLICGDVRSHETKKYPVARRLKTDADGDFRARDLPKKRLLITATSKGRCYYMPGLEVSFRAPCWYPVTYRPGRDSVTGVRLVLRPGAAIAGTVVDTEGEPVPKAIVTLRYVRDAELEIVTDAAGRFRTENVQSGWYSVRAKAEGFASLWLDAGVRTDREDLIVRLPRTCTVEGRVLLADTGEPVAGAAVTPRIVQTRALHVECGGSVVGETVETDSDGVFKVSVLPGMDAELSASWKEYYSKEKATVHVEEEGVAPPVTIELVKGAMVSGTVIDDETDAPVPGVHVRGHRVRRIVTRSVRTEGDEEGRFTLGGLAEGKNRIHTTIGPEFPSPNLADSYRLGGSVVVEVVVGEHQSGIELRLTKKPAIAGKVVDEEGEPIFGALLVVKGKTDESGWSGPLGRGFSEGDGTFVMRMRQYHSTIMGLLVSHPLYANTELSFEPDGVTSGTKEVVVVLKKEGASIEGTVLDENGEPQAQAAVQLLETRRSWSSVGLKATTTDEEGHYILVAVADGTYRVKASLGEREVVSGVVPIVGGKKVTGVNLALPALGHIAGRVTDDQDQPLAGFRVSIHWSRGARDGATDSDGRYRFDDLAEGEEYHVWVSQERGFARVGSHSREVTCSADDVDFTFKAIGFGTVSGFVYQESDGRPVTEFYLRVSGKGNRASSSGRFNSEDGSFSLADVAAGLSVIEVNVGGRWRHTTEPFEVVAGEEVFQVIYLPETGSVRGSVVRASDGRPVTKFRLSLIDQAHSGSWRTESHYFGKVYESEEGLFQCEDVKPGRYIIGVVAEGLPDFKSEAFEVTAGAEAVQEIVIGEGGIIRGVVVDESGLPVQDAVVEVVWGKSRVEFLGMGRISLTPPRDTTDKAGTFELTKITPGKVTLRVTHADYASLEVRDIAVSEDAPVENLELKLERGSVVFGWVKDADGELRGDVGVSLSGQESKYTRTDYRGRYRFEHAPVGTYRLRISYLDARLPNFEVKSGEDSEINIDFAEAGTISGTVHAPAEGDEVSFRVMLEGRDEAAGVYRSVDLRGKNAFKLEGVFPGKYVLRLRAYWKDSEGRRGNPTVTTDPSEIIIEIAAKERVTQDITITKIEERE